MRLIKPALIASIFILQNTFCLAAAPLNNPELERLRNTLPEKALTLDLVVARALDQSDGFQTVKSQMYNVPVAKLRAHAAFDTQIKISQGWQNNKNDSNSPQSPNSTVGNNLSVGVSKYFSTGTAAALNLSQGYSEIDFPTGSFISIPPYYETKAGISLTQNLWADSFGYSSRRALKAAELATDAQAANFQSSVENWALGMIATYYKAWFSQAQTLAAQESLKRRERLLNVTKLRLNRGNAEQPDYLQIESAFLMSRARKLEAEKNLDDQWRRLVVLLKLPPDWLDVDSTDIPIKIDDITPDAEKVCQSFRNKGVPPDDPAMLRAALLLHESAVLNWEAAKNKAWPDLKLSGNYFLNGIDGRNGVSATETFDSDHPGWSVGISLSLPLEFSQQKAELSEAIGKKMQAEALKNNAKDDRNLSWLNECANLERLLATIKDAQKAFKNQNRRADLEERRFQLGRSSTLNVIQAGDDETESQIFLYSTEVQMRLSAWRVLELNSQIVPKLKSYAIKHNTEFKLE